MERFVAQGLSLIISIIIARILLPSDYAIVSIVTIFFTFANVLISGGFNTALIQKKDAKAEDYSSVLYLSLFLSILVYSILFLGAPFIANIYHLEELILVIRIMGLSLPITAFKSIWCAFISSHFMFKKFFFATLGGTIVSGIVGIGMALKGFGPWALITQQMVNTIIDTILLVLTTRIGLVFKVSLSKLKELYKYGWKILVSSLLGTTYAEITPLFIGIKFSANDLSFYSKGKSFPSMLSSSVTNTLSAVLFPFLSKYQDDKKQVLEYTRRYMQIASFVIFPVMLGFFAISNSFVRVVLTDKWLPSVYFIQVFCICYMFDVVAIGNCETIKAIGRSDVYLVIEIIKKSCYGVTLALFIIFADSPKIITAAYLVCTVIQVAVNCVPNIKLINYRFKDQVLDLLPNLLISSLMCAVVCLVGQIRINAFWLLVIQVLSGIVFFVLCCLITNNKSYRYCINLIKERLTKSERKGL